MSRSGYDENYGDDDPLALGRYRARVNSAMRGKRGQALLQDAAKALDAMTDKVLIPHELEVAGAVCFLGAVGRSRGIEMKNIDPDDVETVAATFDIAEPLVREIVFENDEAGAWDETPQARWSRMRKWVDWAIKQGVRK